MRNTILIVDDELDVINLLKDYFDMNDYFILTAKNGIEAIKQAEKQPDLILLDINMPDFDGLEVCKRIRGFVSCPILFLTAKVEDTDKINGFAVGGDDYIVKPFSIDELGARVTAHIRRDQRQVNKDKTKFDDELVINYSTKEVFSQGEKIKLTKKEFEIIEFLSLNSGQIFDKEGIYDSLWRWDSEGDSSVIAEHIRRIRTKLSTVSSKTYIETVWGVGYKWVR
ncbi:response regulator transcription factor [Fredinandcohnia humi]